MQDRALYSIQEARRLLGGISRNTIYRLLRSGELASVVIGCRRFIAAHSIEEFTSSASVHFCPAIDAVRLRNLRQNVATLPPPTLTQRRAANRGPSAILPSPSHQSRKTRVPT
jgi:excisionase family DNA binding protein